MLASLLYPYDGDAPGLIDAWLNELEGENHIRRYVIEDQTYLEIVKFQTHQKIDHPSKSKLPPFASPREDSTSPRGNSLRTKDQGRDQGEEGNARETRAKTPPAPRSVPVAVSPGANGEFAAAFWLQQQIGLAATAGDMQVLAQVVLFVARDMSFQEPMEAAEWLKSRASEAQGRGDLVNMFWFKDRKFAQVAGRRTNGAWEAFKAEECA
jgi:hypothetical protein